MDEATIYESYVKFCRVVNSPVLAFEVWSRARYAADAEADEVRLRWLRQKSEVDVFLAQHGGA